MYNFICNLWRKLWKKLVNKLSGGGNAGGGNVKGRNAGGGKSRLEPAVRQDAAGQYRALGKEASGVDMENHINTKIEQDDLPGHLQQAEELKKQNLALQQEKDDLLAQNKELKNRIGQLKQHNLELETRSKADSEQPGKDNKHEIQLQESRDKAEKALWSLVEALIAYRDRLHVQLEDVRERKEEAARKILAGELNYTRQMLAEQGIAVLDETDSFNPKLHEITEILPTEDLAQHKKIAFSRRDGYAFGNKIIRCQQVAVYQCSEASGNKG